MQQRRPASVAASQMRKDAFNVEKSHGQKKQAIEEKAIADLHPRAELAAIDTERLNDALSSPNLRRGYLDESGRYSTSRKP